MKQTHLCQIVLFITLHTSSTFVTSQDSCSSNLVQIQHPIPFDTSSLLCSSVWPPHNFILRYGRGSSDVWSFIFSFPLDIKAYAAIGFSKDGSMVGSSAIVGWIPSPGAGGMKLYYLGGKSQDQVTPDKGDDLYVMNASFVPATTSLGYLIFQLKTTQPSTNLLFAIGPNDQFPDYPHYALPKHTDQISITIDYSKGSTGENSNNLKLRRGHGVLNIMGWSILMIIGSMIARFFKQWDPIWFYFHASIQTFSFVAGVIGILCGLLLSKKLNTNVTHHKNIAIVIIVLGFLQVLAIILRPERESKIRKYWNLYHHNVGRILIILAVLNTFYGFHLGGEGSKWFLAYGLTIAILVIIVVILEIRMRIITRKETRSKDTSSFTQSVELAY